MEKEWMEGKLGVLANGHKCHSSLLVYSQLKIQCYSMENGVGGAIEEAIDTFIVPLAAVEFNKTKTWGWSQFWIE